MPTHRPSLTSLRAHTYSGLESGASLIVLGAVHGNEICGTLAIERIVAEFDRGDLQLARGKVTFIPIANPLAYVKMGRAGDRNLNRNLRPQAQPMDYEDRVANALCPFLQAHDVLLDLHSFHTQGQPFVMLGPLDNQGPLEPVTRAAEEESLALRLGPRRIVEGWLDTYATGVKNRLSRLQTARAEQLSARMQILNTDPSYGVGTTEYMRSQGGYAITLECGQHDDPEAPEVAYQAIRNALAHLALINAPAPPVRTDIECLRLAEVTDRLHPEDRFVRHWASYDHLHAGDLIGLRHDGGEVCAPKDGFIVFPNPQALPGNEWFYFAQPSLRVLRASPA
ncbi:MAG: succinylglutamate desuccinylase/aspartoacylase family protein [Burkholderiales bacterium]